MPGNALAGRTTTDESDFHQDAQPGYYRRTNSRMDGRGLYNLPEQMFGSNLLAAKVKDESKRHGATRLH